MNKTAIKIFMVFILTAAVLSTTLLCINFLGFGIIGAEDNKVFPDSPDRILKNTSALYKNGDDISGAIPEKAWCILIDSSGNVIWQHNKPSDIPNHYSINDVAKMTRWFLCDYPVYVRTENEGLFVLGYPKDAVGKYNIEYSMYWFSTLPQRLFFVLIFNILLSAILALIFGSRLFSRIKMLANGISDLSNERNVKIPESGIFKELSHNINETANAISRKNTALSIHDNARRNWVSGISHDIRTPLAIIVGNAEAIERSSNAEIRQKAHIITTQSMKIKKLVADLNLISSLEYDMQPQNKKPVMICPLIRRAASEILNSIASDRQYKINLDLRCENAAVKGDESLLERAVFNLINNSVTHNQSGCIIDISASKTENNILITICDNGCGISDDVIKNINFIPKTVHGIGLPMANKIISVHGGHMRIGNKNGAEILISLPLY